MNAKHDEQKQLQTFELTVVVQSHETWWQSNSTNQISRWKEQRLWPPPTSEAGKSAIPPAAQRATMVLNTFIPWTGHDQKLKCLLPACWWCSADNDFTSSFTSTWLTQQFTLLHGNSNHPPPLQVLPKQLPQCTTPQAAEQQATVSAMKIYQNLTK